MNKDRMPIQPLQKDKQGVSRFVHNSIVRELLDTHPTMDMNMIASSKFTDQERTQFAQLIGYSLSGFGELSYVDDETYNAAENMSHGTTEMEGRNDTLRTMIREVREGLKIIVPAVFKIHPDDLEV